MILLTIQRKGIRNGKFKSMQMFFDIQMVHLSVFEVTDFSRSNLKKNKTNKTQIMTLSISSA